MGRHIHLHPFSTKAVIYIYIGWSVDVPWRWSCQPSWWSIDVYGSCLGLPPGGYPCRETHSSWSGVWTTGRVHHYWWVFDLLRGMLVLNNNWNDFSEEKYYGNIMIRRVLLGYTEKYLNVNRFRAFSSQGNVGRGKKNLGQGKFKEF